MTERGMKSAAVLKSGVLQIAGTLESRGSTITIIEEAD
jgi:hypothetical protein